MGPRPGSEVGCDLPEGAALCRPRSRGRRGSPPGSPPARTHKPDAAGPGQTCLAASTDKRPAECPWCVSPGELPGHGDPCLPSPSASARLGAPVGRRAGRALAVSHYRAPPGEPGPASRIPAGAGRRGRTRCPHGVPPPPPQGPCSHHPITIVVESGTCGRFVLSY